LTAPVRSAEAASLALWRLVLFSFHYFSLPGYLSPLSLEDQAPTTARWTAAEPRLCTEMVQAVCASILHFLVRYSTQPSPPALVQSNGCQLYRRPPVSRHEIPADLLPWTIAFCQPALCSSCWGLESADVELVSPHRVSACTWFEVFWWTWFWVHPLSRLRFQRTWRCFLCLDPRFLRVETAACKTFLFSDRYFCFSAYLLSFSLFLSGGSRSPRLLLP